MRASKSKNLQVSEDSSGLAPLILGGRFNEQQNHARFRETLQQADFVFPALDERTAD